MTLKWHGHRNLLNTEYPHRHRCLAGNSFGQDIIYRITGGKPSKQMLIPYAVKTLQTAMLNRLIQMLSRCGHGIAYTQIEEINTALCLQKMAVTADNDVRLPKNIQATLVWDIILIE